MRVLFWLMIVRLLRILLVILCFVSRRLLGRVLMMVLCRQRLLSVRVLFRRRRVVPRVVCLRSRRRRPTLRGLRSDDWL